MQCVERLLLRVVHALVPAPGEERRVGAEQEAQGPHDLERLPERACQRQAAAADCMLLVGTTAVVYPAADFAWDVRSRGHPLIEVNLDPTVISQHCAVAIHAPAGEVISRIVDRVKRTQRET